MNAGADTLQVWLGSHVVADLTLSRRRVPQLSYRADFIAARGAGALGLSVPLPVAVRPYKGELVDYWVESLLPEGETRTVLERYFRVRRGDGFALLAAIGRDCAGAVAVAPAGHDLGEAAGPLQPLSSAEVGEEVASLRQHPLGVDDEVRVSLGGLQSKLLLVRVDGGWARPLGGTPSTHILKPDPPELPGLVASEAFAQRTAALAGLPAADGRLDSFGGRTVLVVTRFDRELSGGRLVRRHQEDTFTVAIGNTDAHLRNHAFLHDADTLTLAPIYDAAPTTEFAATRQLALWIGGQSLLAVVGRGPLVREMTSWGLDADDAATVFDTTLAQLADAYDEAAGLVPQVRPETVAACKTRTENLLKKR